MIMMPRPRQPRAATMPVIEVARTKTAVRHLCEISSSVHPYPIVVAEMHPKEFDQWYCPDKATPPKKVAELYKERALRLGASPEALDVIGKLCNLTQGERDMAAAKTQKAEEATPRTRQKPAERKPDPQKAAKAQATEKPAKAPKEPAAPRESASAMFKQMIMEADGRSGKCKHTDDEIFAAVQEKFGLDDGKRSYVAWYRNKLKKDGETPPEPKKEMEKKAKA